jgi:hypothetical protein
MGRGTTWQSAVLASLSVSGAFLGATAPIPEVSHGQSANEVVALTTSQNLLATDPTALRRFLKTARPAPVSSEDKARALTALPLEGAVSHLSASARQKLAALTTLLRATEREPVYEIKVIAVPQAGLALYARAVILISEATLTLVDAEELQALVAHEVGHEYVWTERERSLKLGDHSRLKDLELMCDGIAIVMLQGLGMDVSRLMSGVQRINRFNLERFGTANNESDYPTLAQRQVFARAMAARSAGATAEVPVGLDLRIIAHTTLDVVELDRTSETVQRLLAAAGVLSRWRDCSGACSADPGSVAIDVLLLPMTKLTERDVYGEVAHDAITGAPTVLIYVPSIADRVRAIRSSIDGRSNPALATMQTGHLVGAAVAHEVGHALGLRHGARGVMKGRLTVDDALALRTSRLLFTSSESATMRSTLRAARNSVAAAAR